MVEDWHPEDIKAAVRKKGSTLAAIGRPLGLSRQSMALALARPSREAEEAIARYLEIDPQVIWPSRYNPDGSRRRPQPPQNYQWKPRFAETEAFA